MNSLYGRFGMNEILFIHNIIDEVDLNNYIDKYSINEIIPLQNNKILISYFDNNIKDNILGFLISVNDKNSASTFLECCLVAYYFSAQMLGLFSSGSLQHFLPECARFGKVSTL
jgi:hypothetical protein